MKLKLKSIAYHTNGVAGEGFHAIAFKEGDWNMVATVFDRHGQVAVLDADRASCGMVGAANSHDSTIYEPQLRQWVAQHWDNRDGAVRPVQMEAV